MTSRHYGDIYLYLYLELRVTAGYRLLKCYATHNEYNLKDSNLILHIDEYTDIFCRGYIFMPYIIQVVFNQWVTHIHVYCILLLVLNVFAYVVTFVANLYSRECVQNLLSSKCDNREIK